MKQVRVDILIVAICLMGIFFIFLNRRLDLGDSVFVFLLAALFEAMRRADRISYPNDNKDRPVRRTVSGDFNILKKKSKIEDEEIEYRTA